MKRRASQLIFYFAVAWLVSSLALAQDELDAAIAEPLVPDAFKSELVYNEIELGIGYVSEDAYKFGRYNGLQTKGAFLLGEIDAENFEEDGNFWNIHGTNLGLESRYLRMEGGLQGRYKFFLEYDELPNYKDNTVETPFNGIGGDSLTLPSDFVDINTDLDRNMSSFELETKRERINVGTSLIPKQHWQFDINFSHETKQGIDSTGSAIANGKPMVVRNTTITLLPEPIDYDTDLVNATLHYIGDDSQFGLTYHMSLFNNTNESLSWQDPFNPVSASGRMSLAPDNEFHQISLNGGYMLPHRSRLSGLVSIGRMTQNQEFLPYTINPTLITTPLPRSSLNAEVWLSAAQLKLTSRPVNNLRLNAELRYNERDNQTEVDEYDYVVLDSFGADMVNRPYSFKNNRINLDANYRFSSFSSLRGGYKYDYMRRSYINSEREETQEDTFFAKWKIKPQTTVDVALFAEVGSRDGSDYNDTVNQNPAMRKFNLANRDRTKTGAKVDYMVTEKLFLSARADYNKDDYKNTSIGLTEATQPVYTVDFSYQPRKNITTHGFYTYEKIESIQKGEDQQPSSTAAAWEAGFDDYFDTAGVSAKITGLGKWGIGMDVLYSKSTGAVAMKDLANLGTEVQYPDTKTELTSVKLWTTYDYSKQITCKLGYWYEEYSENYWTANMLPYDTTSVDSALLLGSEPLDYNLYTITLSASYKF